MIVCINNDMFKFCPSLSSRIVGKPAIQPMMKFSQLAFKGESRLEPKFIIKKKNCKTGFELFMISHFLSFQNLSHRFVF